MSLSKEPQAFFVSYQVASRLTGGEPQPRFLGPYLKKTEAQYWAQVYSRIAMPGSIRIEEKKIIFPSSLYGGEK